MCMHSLNCVQFSCIQLITNVRLSSPPFPVMNEENMEKLKVVMSSRYDPSVKMLDLAALYEDKNLQQEGLFLPMNRPVIATCVGKIIQQHIPEVSPFLQFVVKCIRDSLSIMFKTIFSFSSIGEVLL